MPFLKQCCCGCTLQTGTLIIGWIEVVLSILEIGIFSVALNAKNDKYSPYSTYSSSSSYSGGHVYTSSSVSDSSSELNGFGAEFRESSAFMSILIGFKFIVLIAAILMIVGANKLNKRLLLPYLIVDGINIIINCCYLLFYMASIRSFVMAISFLTAVAIMCIYVYLYLAIFSFYQECRERESALPMSVPMQPINQYAQQPMNYPYYPPNPPQYSANPPPVYPNTPQLYPNLPPENVKFLPPTAPGDYYPEKQ